MFRLRPMKDSKTEMYIITIVKSYVQFVQFVHVCWGSDPRCVISQQTSNLGSRPRGMPVPKSVLISLRSRHVEIVGQQEEGTIFLPKAVSIHSGRVMRCVPAHLRWRIPGLVQRRNSCDPVMHLTHLLTNVCVCVCVCVCVPVKCACT